MSGYHHHPSANHHHSGDAAGHDHGSGHHHDKGQITRPQLHLQAPKSRRAFLGDFGRGTLALAVFTPVLAACSSSGSSDDGQNAPDTTNNAAADTETSGGDAADQSESATETLDGDGGELRWGRANLGFVSAYILARGNTAAIVDTGSSGSAETIGQALSDMGLNYSNVAHVILTHHHGDHVGSIDEVLKNTPSATVYAGEADLGSINVTAGGAPVDSSRIQALTGGEDIFGFEALATPGHTAGHMAAIDHTAGLLVAGDAIFTEGTSAVEGPERFFADVAESRQSIARMAELSFNTLLVGHGDPLESGADAAVAALAASFG